MTPKGSKGIAGLTDKELETALKAKQKREEEQRTVIVQACMDEVQTVLDKHGCAVAVQITAFYDPKDGITRHGGQPVIQIKASN